MNGHNGRLKFNFHTDRWRIEYDPLGHNFDEITSGMVIEIFTGREWTRTRIESDAATKAYYPVNPDVVLMGGLQARLP